MVALNTFVPAPGIWAHFLSILVEESLLSYIVPCPRQYIGHHYHLNLCKRYLWIHTMSELLDLWLMCTRKQS